MIATVLLATFLGAASTPIILDTDIGGDIDDTWCLCMLAGSPSVDLKLVVTAFENTPRKAVLTAKMLERIGRGDIPIGIGVKTKDIPTNQESWIGDYALDTYKGKVHPDGVQAMIDAIHASPVPVTLLVIGPQTNIAEALKRAPDIAQKARVVAMAGSVEIGYGGKKGADPEYNVVVDIPAVRAVLAAPWDITYAPLDSCGTVILKGARYAAVAESKNPRAQTVIENYKAWTNNKNYPEGESSVLFDTVAAYLAFDGTLCEMKTVKLSVTDKGVTAPDEKGRPVHCAMGWKDREQYDDLLVETLK